MASVRRWWVIPPPALRRPFFLAFVTVLIAVSVLAVVAHDAAMCPALYGCDPAVQWALLLPLWWPAYLWGPDPPAGAMLLAPVWWILVAWAVARAAITLWLRYGSGGRD